MGYRQAVRHKTLTLARGSSNLPTPARRYFRRRGVGVYKTEIIPYTASAKKRAKLIEDKINEMTADGYVFVSICSTPNCGAILIFKNK